MGNVGGGEILVLLLVALIFLGPDKLPEVARQVGKVVGEIRRVTSGFQQEMQDAIRMIDDAANEVTSAPTPAPVDAVVLESSASVIEGPLTDLVPAAHEPSEVPSADTEMTATADTVVEADPQEMLERAEPSAAPPLPVDTAHGGDR